MATPEDKAPVGPRHAPDGLIETWMRSFHIIQEYGHEIAVGTFKFETVGPKTIALIMPKDGELDIIKTFPRHKTPPF